MSTKAAGKVEWLLREITCVSARRRRSRSHRGSSTLTSKSEAIRRDVAVLISCLKIGHQIFINTIIYRTQGAGFIVTAPSQRSDSPLDPRAVPGTSLLTCLEIQEEGQFTYWNEIC